MDIGIIKSYGGNSLRQIQECCTRAPRRDPCMFFINNSNLQKDKEKRLPRDPGGGNLCVSIGIRTIYAMPQNGKENL